MRTVWLPLGFLFLAGCDCGDRLVAAGAGTLRVTCLGADPRATQLEVIARRAETDSQTRTAAIDASPMVVVVDDLNPGLYEVRVVSRDAVKKELQSVWVSDVEIVTNQVTELEVDLRKGEPPPPEICDGIDNNGDGRVDEGVNLALCSECRRGLETPLTDDERCGVISCGGLSRFELRGDNTAAGSSTCVQVTYADLTSNRCEAIGRCTSANGPRCTARTETVVASAGLCQTIVGCVGGTASVVLSPDGTPCGGPNLCFAGQCLPPSDGGVDAGLDAGTDAGVDGGSDAGVDPVGCADGTREGFQSIPAYPRIAGCEGAWTVPGVTRPRATMVPTCGRHSGNTGTNTEGTGCAAADLCSAGWHVCEGLVEVAQDAPSGCADSVPAGTLDKMLFFAVSQTSSSNSECADAGDNDVFGCGNLGTVLAPSKNCGVLTRALASTVAGRCGMNEAEPNLGPWQCLGAASDLHEGAVVTKAGCPSTSCSYSGLPVGNSDKGGVLCCRD